MGDKQSFFFRDFGYCIKCKNKLYPQCSNCDRQRFRRYVNWSINQEWLQCKKCGINNPWIMCPNCYTQNPISILGYNFALISIIFLPIDTLIEAIRLFFNLIAKTIKIFFWLIDIVLKLVLTMIKLLLKLFLRIILKAKNDHSDSSVRQEPLLKESSGNLEQYQENTPPIQQPHPPLNQENKKLVHQSSNIKLESKELYKKNAILEESLPNRPKNRNFFSYLKEFIFKTIVGCGLIFGTFILMGVFIQTYFIAPSFNKRSQVSSDEQNRTSTQNQPNPDEILIEKTKELGLACVEKSISEFKDFFEQNKEYIIKNSVVFYSVYDYLSSKVIEFDIQNKALAVELKKIKEKSTSEQEKKKKIDDIVKIGKENHKKILNYQEKKKFLDEFKSNLKNQQKSLEGLNKGK